MLQLNRETFPVSSILKTKTHGDNPRLLGFVACHSSSGELMCYTFESNADGDDVCCAINTAIVMQQSKVCAKYGVISSWQRFHHLKILTLLQIKGVTKVFPIGLVNSVQLYTIFQYHAQQGIAS